MDNKSALNDLLHSYGELVAEVKRYAIEQLSQPLSKAVLQHGEAQNDNRILLDLSNKSWGQRPGTTVQTSFYYTTTPQFRLYVSFFNRMTIEAQCQIIKMNQAMYPFPEIISMMLEQIDYWEIDAPIIVELAAAYINGQFDKS